MFDKNKKHGFVVVEYTGGGNGSLTNGNEYEGFISRGKDAIVLSNYSTWTVINSDRYKITHDLRAPVKVGEEAEFSDDGNDWGTGIFAGAMLSNSCLVYKKKDSFLWKYVRPIQKPDIKISIEIGGNQVNLSDKIEEKLIKLINEN